MIKTDGIVTALSWVKQIITLPVKERKKLRKICLKGIKLFKKGKESSEGEEIERFLKEDCDFIGFAVNISYVMENSKYDDELSALYVHPFSAPTLLYKVKNAPMLVVSNENLNYNKSSLQNIEMNKYNKKLMSILRNSRGIQG
jgi:hypothetical protein